MVVVNNIIIRTFASTMSVDNIFVSGLGVKNAAETALPRWILGL